jgi:ubiquinone biosynthesis UbiH/UbiF/VisC/COQ6 family hydroxylase
MRVWDASGPGSVSFNSVEANSENLGVVVENSILTNAVYDCLNEFENVSVLAPDVVENVVQQSDPSDPTPLDVSLKTGGEVSTHLLIGSDGANSGIRKTMGITKNVGWKYNQKAVVCSVKFDESVFCSTAFQRFLPNGPIALLPMFDNFGSIVWSTTPGHADALVKMEEAEFFTELQKAFNGSYAQANPISDFFSSNMESKVEIPEIEAVVGPRASFPLQISQCYPYVKNRFALVGDAAHTTHPLAGQGFNLALSDVACLVERLESAVQNGEDIGSHMVLQDYQRERLIDNSFTLFGVDAIQKIFSVQYSPWVMARGAGMLAVDNLPFVKKMLIQRAAGKQSTTASAAQD